MSNKKKGSDPKSTTNHAAAGQSHDTLTIVTDAAGLIAGFIDIPSADGTIPGYRARPDNK
jgi:carboxymethylenebutenolidase